MPVPPSLFEEIYRRHGHRCPMSTLGGRLGHAALRSLGAAPRALRAVYHARTCAVDGVAVATGCCDGEGAVAVRDEGRHLLRLVCPESGAGVEAELRDGALGLAAGYRDLSEEARDALLERLRTLPEEELLALRPVTGGTDA